MPSPRQFSVYAVQHEDTSRWRSQPRRGGHTGKRHASLSRKKCGLIGHQSIRFNHISMTRPKRCLKFADVLPASRTVNQLSDHDHRLMAGPCLTAIGSTRPDPAVRESLLNVRFEWQSCPANTGRNADRYCDFTLAGSTAESTSSQLRQIKSSRRKCQLSLPRAFPCSQMQETR
jgi:hypothetical protein